MLSETEVIVRATRSRVASVPGELSFSVGDVIVYLPQRGRSGATGMAMGRWNSSSNSRIAAITLA